MIRVGHGASIRQIVKVREWFWSCGNTVTEIDRRKQVEKQRGLYRSLGS